jgi:DNA-binding CsgD family transcriptional regulator
MVDTAEFADVVALLYEAAVLPEIWPAAIARVAALGGCQAGLLLTSSGQGTNWASSDAFADAFARFMQSPWAGSNPRMAGLLAHGGSGFITDLDLFAEEDLGAIPLYRDFLYPEGLGWGAATHVRAASGDAILFTLERARALGPVSRREVAFLGLLRPHLARAALLAARLQLRETQAILEALERAATPAALIGARGGLVAVNPGFEALLGQVVIRARDRVALHDERANALLQVALASLGRDCRTDTRSIAVPSRGDSPAFIVHVLPLRRQARDLFARGQALLVVTSSERSLQLEPSLLCELYALTRAEAMVANRLLAGLSIDAIAAEHGVSRETVRSQVKKVLAKTACSSQLDLVRRLAPLPI